MHWDLPGISAFFYSIPIEPHADSNTVAFEHLVVSREQGHIFVFLVYLPLVLILGGTQSILLWYLLIL